MSKQLKIWINTFCIFILLIFGLSFYCKNDLEQNILDGQTTWTDEIGFINWGHANALLTKQKLDELISLAASSSKPFSFTYGQAMKQDLIFKRMVFKHQETFSIPANLSEEQVKILFLKILLTVSNEFESMQGGFPINLIPGASGSSFRNGDIKGNLISFYAATRNTTSSEIRKSLSTSSTTEALSHVNESNNWKDLNLKRSVIARELSSYLTLSDKVILSLENKQTSYFLE